MSAYPCSAPPPAEILARGRVSSVRPDSHTGWPIELDVTIFYESIMIFVK